MFKCYTETKPKKSPMRPRSPINNNKSDYIKIFCRIRPINDDI